MTRIPGQLARSPRAQSQASGPLAKASSIPANTKAPTLSTIPDARCRMEVTIWICQRYTCRCGDSGRATGGIWLALFVWLAARRPEVGSRTRLLKNRCNVRSSPNRHSAWDQDLRGHRSPQPASPRFPTRSISPLSSLAREFRGLAWCLAWLDSKQKLNAGGGS